MTDQHADMQSAAPDPVDAGSQAAADRPSRNTQCLVCGYGLAGLRPGPSGVIVCPECGWTQGTHESLEPWPGWGPALVTMCGWCLLSVLTLVATLLWLESTGTTGPAGFLLVIATFVLPHPMAVVPVMGARELAVRHVPYRNRRWATLRMAAVGVALNAAIGVAGLGMLSVLSQLV